MNYDEFSEDIKRGIENMIRDRLGDGMAVIRTVTKNNNVKMRAISIVRKGEKATPTIYLNSYYDDYTKGRAIEEIYEEIFQVYESGIERFKDDFNVNDFLEFDMIKNNVFYKLINYEMNENMLRDLPHFKYLDMAIVFYIMISCDKQGQASAMVHNIHMENWNITPEQLRNQACQNTWKTYPAEIKKMEDIISEMIIGELMSDEESDDGEIIKEDFKYGNFDYDEIENIIREEVETLKADREMEMFVLTNSIRTNGAACITYPGILKEFAAQHGSDVYIIPSSIHEVILIPGTDWEKSRLDKMVVEVNENELDPVEILSDHVYVFKREEGEIRY
ncbi:MAG: DUF5688 family protein [Eubacterium sp.]